MNDFSRLYFPLVKIGILALAVRLIWSSLVPVVPLSDSVAYDAFARTLVEHGVFGWTKDEPLAFWPPGTTFFHAAVYRIFGFDYKAIVALNIVLSLLLIITTARLALRLHGPQVAIASALIIAIWPTLVMYSTVLASELLFVLLTVAALDVWTSIERRIFWRAVLVGVLIGLAALVRPLALALPVVYAVSMTLYNGLSRDNIVRQACIGLISLILMAIVVAPWTWRNYQLYDDLVLVSTNGGITLWMGNAPGTDGRYLPVPEELAGVSDHQQSKILGALARQYIVEDPVGFFVRSLRKLAIMMGNESIGVAWNEQGISSTWGEQAVTVLKRLTQITWAFLLLVAMYGFWGYLRHAGWQRALFSPLTMSIGFYCVVHSIMVAQERYHLSFASQIAIYAAMAYATWRRRDNQQVMPSPSGVVRPNAVG